VGRHGGASIGIARWELRWGVGAGRRSGGLGVGLGGSTGGGIVVGGSRWEHRGSWVARIGGGCDYYNY
jgi:hypothetical protein